MLRCARNEAVPQYFIIPLAFERGIFFFLVRVLLTVPSEASPSQLNAGILCTLLIAGLRQPMTAPVSSWRTDTHPNPASQLQREIIM